MTRLLLRFQRWTLLLMQRVGQRVLASHCPMDDGGREATCGSRKHAFRERPWPCESTLSMRQALAEVDEVLAEVDARLGR